MAEELTALLSAYPTQVLTRQLGERRVSALVQRESSGERAASREGSAVTVELPWIPATVRFICPLEHSSCTCHSRELLHPQGGGPAHLAAAPRIATEESLLAAVRSDTGSVLERRASALPWGRPWRTGCARGLPVCPPPAWKRRNGWRACVTPAPFRPWNERCAGSMENLQGYFARSAAFRAEALLRRMSAVWRLASALRTAPEPGGVQLAGAFREEYQGVGDLRLYLLGLREVDLAGGYAGTVYYFWETQKHRYYAYRDLRPQFYEGRRRPVPIEAILWELPGTLRQAWNCRIDLTGARVSGEGSLSATTQCRGTLLQKTPPGLVLPLAAVEEDFSALLPRSRPGLGELDRLAILRPHRGECQEYDRVEQRFTLRLLDGAGRISRGSLSATGRERGRWWKPWSGWLAGGSRSLICGLCSLGRPTEQTAGCVSNPIQCFTNWEGTP